MKFQGQITQAAYNLVFRKPFKRRRYERTLLLRSKNLGYISQDLTIRNIESQHESYGVKKLILEHDDAYCFLAEPDLATGLLNKFRMYILREPTLQGRAYTMYKRVDQKIKPVSTRMPPEASVRRVIPEDPLASLSELPTHPPDFIPSARLTHERLKSLEINTGFLTSEEEKLFNYIMKTNEKALAFEDIERGTLRESYFSDYVIPTIPHNPWEYRNMPIPPGIMDQVIEVLKLKIDAGVYEPSESSYRSRWFCVVKKNGKLRIVHDLQPLNKVSIRDAGMLPVVDDFVEGFAARQCYTVFDLFWGFDARRVARESRELTAFMTPLGLLQITSLPTGYTNAPSEFQKSMVFILQDEIPDYANIFIDDLAIKGPRSTYTNEKGKAEVLPENPGIRRFIWEHAQDVHRIMHRITLAGATFSGSKTQICRPEVLIIGQKCNAQGRAPDDAKVKKILEWPALTNPKEVRQFLGLAGTMRIWISNYSELVRPLTQLYHKDKEFYWGEAQDTAFSKIKKRITSAPVLKPIDYESDNCVILSVDSSKYATGFILWQLDDEGRKHPARYGSLPMSDAASRYSQAKLELFGLYKALRHWRFYIIGLRNLVVEMDAKYVKGMLAEPDLMPDAVSNRWIQGILMFDFELVHIPADRFKGPDALSRWPYENNDGDSDPNYSEEDDAWLDGIALTARHATPEPTPILDIHQPGYDPLELPSCFLSRIQKDEELKKIRHFLTTLQTPVLGSKAKERFLKKAERFIWTNDHLYRVNDNTGMPRRVLIDAAAKYRVLVEAHEHLGHRGVDGVYGHLKPRFYWPHMLEDIRHHVKTCHECQIRSNKRFHQPITVSTPIRVFEKIYMDVMRMPVDRHNKSYIIAAKDDLTGVVEARALTAANSNEVRKFLWEQIYCRYGAPEHITTDNGSEFKKAFKEITTQLRIPQVTISAYNSQANGVVERGHYILREAIVKACKGNLKHWSEKVPEAVFADRVTVKRSTGFSPYELLHGCEPLLPLDLMEITFLVEDFHAGMSESDLLAARIRQLQKLPEDIRAAAQTLKEARFRSKVQFEKKFHHKIRVDNFEPGDMVLVRNSPIEKSLKRKQFPRYLGPYRVVRKNTGGAYILAEMDGAQRSNPIAAFRLTPYIKRDHWFMQPYERLIEDDSGDDSNPPPLNLLKDYSTVTEESESEEHHQDWANQSD